MELKGLKTKFLGRNVIYYESIDSTQLEILRKIENNIPNGTIIITDLQTNGIGTHGRKWYTTEKENIAFSFIIYANCKVEKLKNITREIAETLNTVIKNLYNIELSIKEPNDIVHNSKKIGGILAQNKLNGEIVKYMVVGIGINTKQINFPKEIENIATSIKKEFNIEVDRIKIITEFCNLFESIFINKVKNQENEISSNY